MVGIEAVTAELAMKKLGALNSEVCVLAPQKRSGVKESVYGATARQQRL
jgi:hypothetical protein